MGANAQLTVPTFSTGQTLSADALNQSARTGVPVFAGTSERDAGFGGSGEKTLAEGQLCYLESTNVVQYYDGSTWATVGPAPASTAALELVTTVTISAASTTNVDNCFTSTYQNYQLVMNITTSANTGIAMRMRVGGSDNSTSNYGIAYRYNALTQNNVGDAVSVGQTQFNLHISNICRAINGTYTFYNPQVADRTTAAFSNTQADNSVSDFYSFRGGLEFNATTQFDGFSIYTGGAPTISGTIKIYGMR
jgi:hypothetical protein